MSRNIHFQMSAKTKARIMFFQDFYPFLLSDLVLNNSVKEGLHILHYIFLLVNYPKKTLQTVACFSADQPIASNIKRIGSRKVF